MRLRTVTAGPALAVFVAATVALSALPAAASTGVRSSGSPSPARSAWQIQSVEASASTSSANISEGFFQSKILRGRSLISAATIAR
jgi:hypothetical protein